MKLANSIIDLKPLSTANPESTFTFRLETANPPSEEALLQQQACNSSSVPEPDAGPSTSSSHKTTTTSTPNERDRPLSPRIPSPTILPEEEPRPVAPSLFSFSTNHSQSAAHTHPPKTIRALQSLSNACRRFSSGFSDRVPTLSTLTSWVSAWAQNPGSPPLDTHKPTTASYYDDVDTASPSPYDTTCRTSSAATSVGPSCAQSLPPRPDCGSSQSCSIGSTTISNGDGPSWSLRFISFSSHVSSAAVPRGGEDPAATNNIPTATGSNLSTVKTHELTNCWSSSEHPDSAAFKSATYTVASSATLNLRHANSECSKPCNGPSTQHPPPPPTLPPLQPQPGQPPLQKQQNNSDASKKEALSAAVAFSNGPNEDHIKNSNGSRNISSGGIRYSGFTPRPIPCEGLLYIDPSVQQTMWNASRGARWSVRQYDITRKLYEGYASCVCKATCLTSHTDVVLKMYPLTELSGFVRHQILRELDIHSRLKHPGVVQLLAAFREDNMLVFVLEYVRGGSLDGARRKLEGGRLAEQWVVRLVAVPLLRVLSCMHRQGLVHRDVKPDNLLLTPQWRLKLCDFGISIDIAQERAVTRAGSWEYMAPEVNACPLRDKPADNKANELIAYGTAADVWSLGVVLYELLVGFPPFPAGPPLHSVVDESNVATVPSSSITTITVPTATTTVSVTTRPTTSTPNNGQHCTAPRAPSSTSTPAPPLTASPSQSSPHSSLVFLASVSPMGRSFILSCLQPLPVDRPTVEQLLSHPWLQLARAE